MSLSLFSGNNKVAIVPSGNAANASSVGANTVNGPSPFKVSTRPAACTAATNVVKDPAPTAVSTMSCEWPPAKAIDVDASRAAEVIDKKFYKTVLHSFQVIRPFFDYMSSILTTNLNGESLIDN